MHSWTAVITKRPWEFFLKYLLITKFKVPTYLIITPLCHYKLCQSHRSYLEKQNPTRWWDNWSRSWQQSKSTFDFVLRVITIVNYFEIQNDVSSDTICVSAAVFRKISQMLSSKSVVEGLLTNVATDRLIGSIRFFDDPTNQCIRLFGSLTDLVKYQNMCLSILTHTEAEKSEVSAKSGIFFALIILFKKCFQIIYLLVRIPM